MDKRPDFMFTKTVKMTILHSVLIVKALVGTVKIREVSLTALCTAQQQQQMQSFLEYFTKLHRDI